jgi:4-hydroxybenzoate polyprenyltransferase
VIVEPSGSFAADFLTYAQQRLLRPRMAALVALVAACAVFASGVPRPGFAIPASLILVWQFRLWDDLEDLSFDRIHHPDRVLLVTGMRRTFAATLATTLAIAGAILFIVADVAQALVYAALVAALAAGYRMMRAAPDRRLVRAHWVLVKYPVFVFAAATEPVFAQATPVAVVLYLALGLFEVLDDPTLRGMRAARALAFAEGIAIAGVLTYGVIR